MKLHAATAKMLRTRYTAIWTQSWPEDDHFLKILWDHTKPPHYNPYEARRLECLNAMRENDTTIPASYGQVSQSD